MTEIQANALVYHCSNVIQPMNKSVRRKTTERYGTAARLGDFLQLTIRLLNASCAMCPFVRL